MHQAFAMTFTVQSLLILLHAIPLQLALVRCFMVGLNYKELGFSLTGKSLVHSRFFTQSINLDAFFIVVKYLGTII